MTKLGRMTKVPLRNVWTNESSEFTPWLAKEENLKLLGEVIGIDLELEKEEKNVGDFNADLLCKNTVDNSWVVIENQLEKTDHKHLGQLLTYASGLNAITSIWIAEKFTEEHRATLDWLNEITDSTINFFGLEIELWKIGESPIAPKFNIVCKPNDWVKTVTQSANRGVVSETKQLQQEYWTAFREYAQSNSKNIKPQKPLPQHWTNLAIGRSYFHLVATVNTWDKQLSAYLCLSGPDAKPHFYLLQQEKEAINKEFGAELEWRELPDNKESHITIRLPADPTDKTKWIDQHKWLTKQLEAFYRVFPQRIRNLNAEDYKK